MNRAFSFSCNPDGSRRFPVGDGTPTGPLTQTWGYQGTSRTAPKSWTSQKPTSLFDTRGSRGGATQWGRWEGSFSILAGGSRRLCERPSQSRNATDWRSGRSDWCGYIERASRLWALAMRRPQIASLFPRMLEAIGVNQSLREGVSSPAEAIPRSISSHACELPTRLMSSGDRCGSKNLLTKQERE
jgi:hypothetical protein